jgi:hypothetical protein
VLFVTTRKAVADSPQMGPSGEKNDQGFGNVPGEKSDQRWKATANPYFFLFIKSHVPLTVYIDYLL